MGIGNVLTREVVEMRKLQFNYHFESSYTNIVVKDTMLLSNVYNKTC